MGMTVDSIFGKRIDARFRLPLSDFARMLANICWSGAL